MCFFPGLMQNNEFANHNSNIFQRLNGSFNLLITRHSPKIRIDS